MKSKKKFIVNFTIFGLILSSCSTASVKLSNEAPAKAHQMQGHEIDKYLSYQHFDIASVEELNQIIVNQSSSREQNTKLQKLKRNVKKITSKKSFTLNINNSNIHSLALLKLIYKFDLPISIAWDELDAEQAFNHLASERLSGFCNSIFEDTLEAIAGKISNAAEETIVIYVDKYSAFNTTLSEQFPELISIELNKNNPLEFASTILGIDESNDRFKEITNLNPNQKLEFTPRSREDTKNIVLLLEPDQYKSVLPAFRYHGGNKFEYINFSSAIESLGNLLQLLDFEKTQMSLSSYLLNEIKNKNRTSLDGILGESALNDWLIVQVLKQAGVDSALVNGMSGKIIYKRDSCAKRIIPLISINSQWVTS